MDHISQRSNVNLSLVYKNTVDFFQKNEYPLAIPEVFLPKKYTPNPFLFSTKPLIEVTDEDSFIMAERYTKEGLNPLVFNFASDYCPGGGVKKGSRAQEEDLFRRSNYHQSLNKEMVGYPLKGKIIYSPIVHICKTPEYKWKRNFVEVSCIAAAAVRKPKIRYDSENKERFAEEDDRFFMLDSIFQIFEIAKEKKHNSLVLGAWGCGAFRGPRDDIINLFKEAILEHGKYFSKIGFGVLVRNKGDNENFIKFKDLENTF